MALQKGRWIPLEEGASELLLLGSPRIGDPVRLDYDEKRRKWLGTARRIKHNKNDISKAAESPEYGVDIIYSASFGI